MFFKKKDLTCLKMAPLNYWEESSYFLVLLPNDEDILTNLIPRVESIKGVKIKGKRFETDTGILFLELNYCNADYEVGFYLSSFHLPEYYLRKTIFFKEEELQKLALCKRALTIYMPFKNNVKESYQLQLKLAVNIVPDSLAIMDESSERLIPMKWAKMTADSRILPSSHDLFTIQAVITKNKEVWLHTHGLCRCHLTELEIVESHQKDYINHYNLLNALGSYLIDIDKQVNSYDGIYIGEMAKNKPIVVTFVPWDIALKEYPKLSLGNYKDRINGHNTNTSIIFLYLNREDEINKKISKISAYDASWSDNPLIYVSDVETKRMKDLAIERFSYVRKYAQDKNTEINIKIGLLVDKQDNYEHIWFKLLEIKGDKFKAELLQEPYNIKDKHEGDINWFNIEDITDWIIYTNNLTINPGNVYLLED